MKRAIFLSVVLACVSTTSSAMADSRYGAPDQAALKALSESLVQKHVDLMLAKIEKIAQTSPKEVSFQKAGLGIGGMAGSNTTTGGMASTAAGIHVRSFQEGSDSGQKISVPWDYDYSSDRNSAQVTVREAAANELQEILIARGLDNMAVGYAVNEGRGYMSAALENNKPRLTAAVDNLANLRKNARQDQRPMHFFEGNAQYNMIGTQAHGGAFTGVTGDIRGGVGFSLKDFGKNGCDIYFMATGNLTGQAHYNASSLDSFRGAAGIEQGLLCQVNDAVTFMASPSVQIGGLRHALPNSNIRNKDGAATTDWLNYAARGRLILNDKLYLSGEFVHHPDMKGGSAHWKATEVSGNVDFKVNDKWVVGARVKNLRMQDTQGQNADINDTQVAVQAYRAF